MGGRYAILASMELALRQRRGWNSIRRYYYWEDLHLAATDPMLRPVGEFFTATVRG